MCSGGLFTTTVVSTWDSFPPLIPMNPGTLNRPDDEPPHHSMPIPKNLKFILLERHIR